VHLDTIIVFEFDSLNSNSPSQSVVFSIHFNGKTSQEFFNGISEFPRIYPSLTGLKNQKIFTVGGKDNEVGMHYIRSLNLDTGKTDKYDYGSEYLVEEHIVVENGRQLQKNGWLIGTALHWPSRKTCVSIFVAENMAAGPIARAWLPFYIPLGFHGNFKSV